MDLGDGISDFLSIATYAWRAALLGYVVRAYGLAAVAGAVFLSRLLRGLGRVR